MIGNIQSYDNETDEKLNLNGLINVNGKQSRSKNKSFGNDYIKYRRINGPETRWREGFLIVFSKSENQMAINSVILDELRNMRGYF